MATSLVLAQHQASSLLRLPAELRLMILRELLVASDRLLDEKTNEPLTHYPIVSATCRNLRRECDAILYRENSLMIKIKVESPEPASWLTPDDLIASVPALAHGQLVRFSSITSASQNHYTCQKARLEVQQIPC